MDLFPYIHVECVYIHWSAYHPLINRGFNSGSFLTLIYVSRDYVRENVEYQFRFQKKNVVRRKLIQVRNRFYTDRVRKLGSYKSMVRFRSYIYFVFVLSWQSSNVLHGTDGSSNFKISLIFAFTKAIF